MLTIQIIKNNEVIDKVPFEAEKEYDNLLPCKKALAIASDFWCEMANDYDTELEEGTILKIEGCVFDVLLGDLDFILI